MCPSTGGGNKSIMSTFVTIDLHLEYTKTDHTQDIRNPWTFIVLAQGFYRLSVCSNKSCRGAEKLLKLLATSHPLRSCQPELCSQNWMSSVWKEGHACFAGCWRPLSEKSSAAANSPRPTSLLTVHMSASGLRSLGSAGHVDSLFTALSVNSHSHCAEVVPL